MSHRPRRRHAVNPGFDHAAWQMAIYERGYPSYRNLIVCRGYIQFNRKTPHTQRLYTEHGNLWVRWFMDRIPPDVRNGDRVSITGNFETMNAGTILMITDALLLTGSYKDDMAALTEVIAHIILDPKSYIEPGEISGDQERMEVFGAR